MKILYTATVLSHICQFHLHYLEMLQAQGHEVHVAAYNNLDQKNGLELRCVDQIHEITFQRSPLKLDNLKAYKQLKTLLDKEKYSLIVCNTPMGGIITRLAARNARRHGTNVIYIAHGFHFFRGAPLKNWLIYYPIEKWMVKYCDILITITKEDYTLAKRRFHANVEHLYGIGVSPERFHPVSEQARHSMRVAENLSNSDFVILCVGELNKNKNQTFLLQAIAHLKDELPQLKVLVAGNGPLESKLKAQAKQWGINEQVYFLGYRTDLEKITPTVDLVVSCSFREGLPLNILEAMLCAKAVIASDNRGHRELVQDGENGYLFSLTGNPEELSSRIMVMYDNAELRTRLGNEGKKKAEPYMAQCVVENFYRILMRNHLD